MVSNILIDDYYKQPFCLKINRPWRADPHPRDLRMTLFASDGSIVAELLLSDNGEPGILPGRNATKAFFVRWHTTMVGDRVEQSTPSF
jgi:hypothetical protein